MPGTPMFQGPPVFQATIPHTRGSPASGTRVSEPGTRNRQRRVGTRGSVRHRFQTRVNSKREEPLVSGFPSAERGKDKKSHGPKPSRVRPCAAPQTAKHQSRLRGADGGRPRPPSFTRRVRRMLSITILNSSSTPGTQCRVSRRRVCTQVTYSVGPHAGGPLKRSGLARAQQGFVATSVSLAAKCGGPPRLGVGAYIHGIPRRGARGLEGSSSVSLGPACCSHVTGEAVTGPFHTCPRPGLSCACS